MISEEEVNLLQQENQALREKADLLQEQSHLLQQTVSLQEETISLHGQLMDAFQKQVLLLTQQVQTLQEQVKEDSYNNHLQSSVRFPRSRKSLRKKCSKKRGKSFCKEACEPGSIRGKTWIILIATK